MTSTTERVELGLIRSRLSDHRSELEWNPTCQVMEKITDGPVGTGTRFRAKWKSSRSWSRKSPSTTGREDGR
jgi:hypothetical protein